MWLSILSQLRHAQLAVRRQTWPSPRPQPLPGLLREIPPKPIRLTQNLQACLEVARAIEHLQARRIMHRDVKTPNVLLADVVVPYGGGIALPPMKLDDLG